MWSMDGDTFKAEKGYRLLNLDTITSIQAKGLHYEIHPEPIVSSIDLSLSHEEQPNNVVALSA